MSGRTISGENARPAGNGTPATAAEGPARPHKRDELQPEPLTPAAEARRRQELADAAVARLRSRRPVVVVPKARCTVCGSDRIKIDGTKPTHRYAHCLTCEAELFVVEI